MLGMDVWQRQDIKKDYIEYLNGGLMETYVTPSMIVEFVDVFFEIFIIRRTYKLIYSVGSMLNAKDFGAALNSIGTWNGSNKVTMRLMAKCMSKYLNL